MNENKNEQKNVRVDKFWKWISEKIEFEYIDTLVLKMKSRDFARKIIYQRLVCLIRKIVSFAVTPAGGPKEVAKEATPPAPECAQGVKAQGLWKALRINTPLEHLSPPFCETLVWRQNQRSYLKSEKEKQIFTKER